MRRWNISLYLIVASAPCVTDLALADIRTTPHSLVRKSVKADASDVCVFCHTPNVSGTAPEKAPLWQRSLGTDAEFVIYDDIGRLGLGKSSVGSQSIACLSCHDANQARIVSKGDHPFGVPYRGAFKGRSQPAAAPLSRPSQEDNRGSVAAKQLVALDDFRDASQGTVENRLVWWVSTSGSGSRRTRNDLPLYSRSEQSGGQDIPYIECSSCHDPHSETSMFLRLPNDGSRLCLTCHLK